MPEAPEINVLVKQLKHILKNFNYNNKNIIDIFRNNKTINILLNDKKHNLYIITIHLMLRGFLSLVKDKYTIYSLKFYYKSHNITLYINDPMRLAKLSYHKYIKEAKLVSFLEYCYIHPNLMIKMALVGYKMGIGRYLLKEIFGKFKINKNTKCRNISTAVIKKIYQYANKLILHITKLHGKHTFRDIYGNYGKYTPKY